MEVNKHLLPWMEISKDSLCTLQSDPTLWSEDVISRTMRKHEATALSTPEAQTFIRDYLKVVCESM